MDVRVSRGGKKSKSAPLAQRSNEWGTRRPGLYRVWVPLHNDGKAPLICIWIDPAMPAFERQLSHEGVGGLSGGAGDGAIAEQIEDPPLKGRAPPLLFRPTALSPCAGELSFTTQAAVLRQGRVLFLTQPAPMRVY